MIKFIFQLVCYTIASLILAFMTSFLHLPDYFPWLFVGLCIASALNSIAEAISGITWESDDEPE